jgi:hypothetical protein
VIADRLVRLASHMLSTVGQSRPHIAPEVLVQMAHLEQTALSVDTQGGGSARKLAYGMTACPYTGGPA